MVAALRAMQRFAVAAKLLWKARVTRKSSMKRAAVRRIGAREMICVIGVERVSTPNGQECKTTRKSSRDASLAKLEPLVPHLARLDAGIPLPLIHGCGFGRGRLVIVSKASPRLAVGELIGSSGAVDASIYRIDCTSSAATTLFQR